MARIQKAWALVLAAALVLALAGCGAQPKAEDTVRQFCDAMKTLDLETMQSSVSSRGEDQTDLEELLTGEDSEEYAFLLDYVKELAGQIDYEITAASQDGDKGTVTVHFKHIDASDVVKRAFQDYLMKGIGMAFSGAGEEEMAQLLKDCFAEAIRTTKTGEAEATIEFKCTKKDGKWLIDEVPDELASVIMGNMDKALEGLSENFS